MRLKYKPNFLLLWIFLFLGFSKEGIGQEYSKPVGDATTLSESLQTSANIFSIKSKITGGKYDSAEVIAKESYTTRYSLKSIALKTLQDQVLAPNQTLLEYQIGDSSLFIIAIQKQKYEVIEVKKNFPLELWVTNMTSNGMAKDKKKALNASTLYSKAAYDLYQKLIQPVLDAGVALGQELIIIPDGILGQVPFEALLTATPKTVGIYHDYPYLLHKHQISYCFSATLLGQMMDKKHNVQHTKTLLGMAPFAKISDHINKPQMDSTLRAVTRDLPLRDTLKSLLYSGSEIDSITTLWRGKALYNQDATTNQFLELAPLYRIIHLATHGKADARSGDYSFLAFNTGKSDSLYLKLYARDLYNVSLNADLVTLSACETGIGQLQKGEGIINLTRAFAFAGAKSIVTSLWSVNDVRTKDLMVLFYKELAKPGMRKDAALRNAKLKYLSMYNVQADPYFWAGFIAIGDMSSIR